MKKTIPCEIWSLSGKRIFSNMIDDESPVLKFASNYGFVEKDKIKSLLWEIRYTK